MQLRDTTVGNLLWSDKSVLAYDLSPPTCSWDLAFQAP